MRKASVSPVDQEADATADVLRRLAGIEKLGHVHPAAGVVRPNPVTVGAGAQFYDVGLHRPIWSDGTVWRDATGITV